jgi:hypothetical protein
VKSRLWAELLLQPLAVGIMVSCIALSVVELIHLYLADWNTTLLLAGCILGALAANYSYSLIRARIVYGEDIFKFRLVELSTFFILLKIGSYAGDSWRAIWADIRTWPSTPWNLFDAETLVAFGLACCSWYAATQTAVDVQRLGEPPDHDRDYVSPLDSLASRFFVGGVALLIFSGLTRLGIAFLLDLRHPPVPGMVLNVLIYFVLGLILLGQVRYVLQRQHWQDQGAKIAAPLHSRWVRYGMALIGLAAVIAFVLPNSYTYGLLEMAAIVLDALYNVLGLISMVLSLLCYWPLSGLAWLLGGLLDLEISEEPPPTELPFGEGTAPGASWPWFEIIKSLVFWVVLVGISFYVLRSYLQERPGLLRALAAFGPIRALRRLWLALRQSLGNWGRVVRQRLPRQWPRLPWRRLPGWVGTPFRFFRLGALSPRERVMYYYLSIVRRAGQQGFPRRASQTPYEYDVSLEPHLPQAQQDLASLTEAFVEARYSRRAVEPSWAGRVRAHWEKVRAALQSLKRN